MQNNLILPNGVNPSPFYEKISEYLSNNLSDKLCSSVSNLLAIDYATRLKSEPELLAYTSLCTRRIKKHLGNLVIINETFSAAMNLFTVAITDQESNSDDEKNLAQSQEVVIDSIIEMHFAGFSDDDKALIKLALRASLNEKNSKSLIDQISSDPQAFYELITNAAQEKKTQQEIPEMVISILNKTIEQSKQTNKKTNAINSVIGQISLTASIFAAASISLVVSGIALPALIVPSVIAAVKYSPIIAEKIHHNVTHTSPNNDTKQTTIEASRPEEIIDSPSRNNAIEQNHDKGLTSEQSIEKLKLVAKNMDIDIKSHATKEIDDEQKPISKDKTQEKGRIR